MGDEVTDCGDMSHVGVEDRTHSVEWCVRCGGTHAEIRYSRFSGRENPFYEFWALCPTTGEPILIRTILGGSGEPFRFRYEDNPAANRSIDILIERNT